MQIGVLILTHDEFAAQLVNRMLSPDTETALPMRAMSIHQDFSATVLSYHLSLKLHELDQGAGVLVLCDYVCEAMNTALQDISTRLLLAVVSGINHIMVNETMEHPERDLKSAAISAANAGKQGIKVHGYTTPH